MTEGTFRKLLEERKRQEAKHPSSTCASDLIPEGDKVAILTEELGEVARAVLDKDDAQLEKELIHVAAVAVAWLEVFE